MNKYKLKIIGIDMSEDIEIEVEAISNIQAMFLAQEEANRLNLEWDVIEFSI